jgi:hypothetical protein
MGPTRSLPSPERLALAAGSVALFADEVRRDVPDSQFDSPFDEQIRTATVDHSANTTSAIIVATPNSSIPHPRTHSPNNYCNKRGLSRNKPASISLDDLTR